MVTNILVLASNPQGTQQLRLNPEIREIEDALDQGQKGDRFDLRSRVAVRVDDLQKSIAKSQARIVHFCGHGAGSPGLVLETDDGQQQLLNTSAIADLFALFKNQVDCVVLNACYSEEQAQEIRKHINYVFGTKKAIRDDAAIAFSKGFYEALGNGKTIKEAFDWGKNRIQLDIYQQESEDSRKLVPIFAESENKYLELPEHEVVQFLIKDEPLNSIIKFDADSVEDRQEIVNRPLNTKSPYKSLNKFTINDKDLFFGRDRLIYKLTEAINRSNLLLVLGASGSGKSSVVRAGVIPELNNLASVDYEICIFNPDRNPFESLKNCLSTNEHISNAELDFLNKPQQDTISKIVKLLKKKHSQWLIFIDQFEELFTFQTNKEDKKETKIRKNFLLGLSEIARASDSSIKLVLAMRSDFLEEFSPYPQFAKLAQKHIHLITDMEPNELRQAITKPAAKRGVAFEQSDPDLVNKIIEDVQGQAGSLPLLQYTLDLLWQNDDLSDRELNMVTYHQLGGVTGALQKHVNQIYKKLSPEKQQSTKQILLQLVDVVNEDKSQVLKTAVSKRSLKKDFNQEQLETIQFLVDENLLISNDSDLTQEGVSTIEIAHEALLSSWTELKQWILDAKDTIALHNQLKADLKRHRESQQKDAQQAKDELWGGSKLVKAIELNENGTFERVVGGLSDDAKQFLAESVAWRDRKIQEELEAARKLAEAEVKAREEAEKREREQKQANKKLTIWSLVAIAFAITATGLGIYSYLNSQEAQLKAEAANIKVRLSLSSKIEHLLESIQLAGKNQNFNQSWFNFKSHKNKLLPEVQSVLYQALEANRERASFHARQDAVESLAISPDGSYIVIGSSDGKIKLWDVHQQLIVHTFEERHQGSVNSVAISPDGKYIASGSYYTKLWDVEKKSLVHTFERNQSWISSVAISPDAKYIVTGDWGDNTVKLWDLQKQSLVHTFEGHQDNVESIVISPDGKYIVSGSDDKTVKLWSIEKKSLVHTFDEYQNLVKSVVISPDGKYIVSGSWDKTVKLWDMEKKSVIHTFEGHQDNVESVAISPDGKYIVSGSRDRTVKLWDVEKKSVIHTFEGHQDNVESVAISPDGKYIVSNSITDTKEDSTMKLWDIQQQSLIQNFKGHEAPVNSVAVSPDSEYIVSGGSDGKVKRWDVQQPSIVHTFDGYQASVNSSYNHDNWIKSVAISPDGKYIVSSNWNGTLKLWDNQQKLVTQTFNLHNFLVNAVAIGNEGKYIFIGSEQSVVLLFDVKQQQITHTFEGHQSAVNSVAISPNHKYIVSGGSDAKVKLWDVERKSVIHTFEGHQSAVNSAAISPDGKYIISGSGDRTVRLWNVGKKSLIHTFEGHQDNVESVAISSDGKYIISGSWDGKVKLWNVGKKSLIHTFEEHQDNVQSVAISPDGKYIVSGSWDGKVKIWAGTVWQDWLEDKCEGIRLHPALVSREIASAPGAADACMKYGDWSEQEKAELLVKQGLALATEEGNHKAARSKFQQAKKFKSDIDLNPNTEEIDNNPETAARDLSPH
ncbi:MAG: CHAT domain-containing protein [Cyanobacteria bacterium P01_G01_bin.39]